MRVCDSQAYRKLDVTRECISRILELREILLSFQAGLNLVNAAVVCAILESISGNYYHNDVPANGDSTEKEAGGEHYNYCHSHVP